MDNLWPNVIVLTGLVLAFVMGYMVGKIKEAATCQGQMLDLLKHIRGSLEETVDNRPDIPITTGVSVSAKQADKYRRKIG